MAINSLDLSCYKPISKSHMSSNSSKAEAGKSCRLVKINFAMESGACKRVRKKNTDAKSVYLKGDDGHLDFFSSFPLAANIYKANSDEFECFKKANKNAKKSVLTLPNNQAPKPQTCTVSDINDSEYEGRSKLTKRNSVPRHRKSQHKGRNYEFYDGNAKYCSQMNLDCSSTDTIHNDGYEKRRAKSKSIVRSKQQAEQKPNPHDVWAVLRNINRFQFRPSPPMSTDSLPSKKKVTKGQNNRKDMRVVKTCRTEEFAYISSFEVDSRTPQCFSNSSSFDRITVIDKQDNLSQIYQELEKNIVKEKKRSTNNKPPNRNQNSKAVNNYKNTTKACTKSITPKVNNLKALPLDYNSNKQRNNICGEGDTKQNTVHGNMDSPAADSTTKTEYLNPLYNETNDNQFLSEIDGDDIVEQKFIHSGFSKTAAKNEIIGKEVPGRTKFLRVKVSSDENHNTFNGITKVVLSKGPTIPPPKRPEPPKRKRQTSLLPSHPVVPKSTTDNYRRLAKLKFPIVILGKDQLSSTYQVLNPESTQFNGLNEQVWPFMEQWQNGDGDKLINTFKKNNDNLHNNEYSSEILKFNKTQKMNRGLIHPKQLDADKKTIINHAKNNNKGKIENKRVTPPAELQQQAQPKNNKPIRQFKEKMLKLLYKNSSIQSIVGANRKTGENNVFNTKHAPKITSYKVVTSADTKRWPSPKDTPGNRFNSPVTVKAANQVPPTNQLWAKAKRASDFIDNVIRKVKNGVYYTHDSKHGRECKEAEIQTVATNNENPKDRPIAKIFIKKKDSVTIPGFDDHTLPAMEIKTMTTNEISVKHCVTNVIVHFNVGVPNESGTNIKRSSSLLPLDVTESQTKIFKCKTAIINAMLPAEICSILPKMMSNILEAGQTLALPPMPVDKHPSHLSIITEVANYESYTPFNPLFPHLNMSLELQELIYGFYPNKPRPKREVKKKIHAKYDRHLAKELLPCLSRSHLFDSMAQPISFSDNDFAKHTYLGIVKEPVTETVCKNKLNKCMALQPYPVSNRALVLASKPFDLTGFLPRMSGYLTDNILPCSRVNNITVYLTMTNSLGLEDRFSIMVSKLMMKPESENVSTKLVSDTFSIKNKKDFQCIELKAPSDKHIKKRAILNNKPKQKGFIKLYRKCKSTSNIFEEKTSTSLSQITNLDEFLQALGAAKLFTGVFDDIYSHKILSSLKEMECWITDINPTQALLVLLLMNKKDTPNLVRFRPVLLQGIAVNRITQANELDMEIEVIEREHRSRLIQHEGMSYLPESADNQDNLLEELCWIAKTTASDYQRIFDESSEKLLKSLLEKRKKLNPSYLRVMARYVGLGLLKSPTKK